MKCVYAANMMTAHMGRPANLNLLMLGPTIGVPVKAENATRTMIASLKIQGCIAAQSRIVAAIDALLQMSIVRTISFAHRVH
jgi:hypothetical protein